MGFCFGWWKIVSLDLFVGFDGGSHLGWDRVDLGFEGFVGQRERIVDCVDFFGTVLGLICLVDYYAIDCSGMNWMDDLNKSWL